MTYLERLNDKQKEAVLQTEGPLLVLAGAGSGKTSMMTCRIAYLIDKCGVSPWNILAVTFTNKAAGEMRERVDSILEEIGRGAGTQNMWIATFHSACLRILRVHADVLGYDKDFVVYDTTDQKTVIKAVIKEQNIDDKKFSAQYLLSIISDCKEKCMDPEKYIKTVGEDFRTKDIYKAYKGYEATLRKNNAMDFDDLLLNTVRLFERDEAVLLKYQNRFKYIMVDEYQDTNTIQYKFVKYLAEANNNICVVGDDDQCIYEWRGADIRNILDFERDFKGAKVIKLEQNYRSYGNILDAAHCVISHNRGRKDKKLWTEKEAGEKIKYHRAEDERDEARYIATEINFRMKHKPDSRPEPFKFGNFAVLYRTNAQSRVFEEIFGRMGVPCKVVGNVGFYDRKEIKDVMSYLRLVQNPKDDVAFERIINEPKRGMGDKTMEKLKGWAAERNLSLLELLQDDAARGSLSAKSYTAVTDLVNLLTAYHDEMDDIAILEIYDGILAKTGYLKALQDANTVEAEGRIENILELRSAIEDFQKEMPEGRLQDFLEGKALASDSDKLPEGEEAENADKVLLMTMHTAKGLEFPVVFMPGLEQGLFPGWRAMDREDGLEEERRLCYVGMTRAKEKLFLTGACMRTLYGKTDFTKESCFLNEIDKKYLDSDISAGTPRSDFGTRTATAFRDGYAENPAPKSPFKGMVSVQREVMAKSAGNGPDLAVGDHVTHVKFGRGEVIEVDAKTVTVVFESEGRKKLARGIAPLKKIEG